MEKQRTNIRQFDTGDIDDSDVQEMAYEYDHKGQTIKTISQPGQPHESFVTSEYDDFGRTIAETNQLGLTRTFTYNDQGQLTAVTLPAIPDPDNGGQLTHPVYRYSYDAQGNMVQLTDPLGRDTRFTFNSRGQQLSRTLPLGFGADGIFGTADDFGPDLKPNTGDEPPLPAGDFTEHMAYDVRGRQTVHISFEGVVTEYVYDDSDHGNGRLKEKRFYTNQHDYDNGLIRESQSMTYDAFGREVRVEWNRDVSQSDGAAIDLWISEYDSQGRLLRVASPTGDINYIYDEFGRQSDVITGTSGSYAGDLADSMTHIRYSYDVLGRLSKVEALEKNGVMVDVDPNTPGDQPETETYAYTLNGSLDYEINPDGSVTDYTYDDLNRLTNINEYRADSNTPDIFTDNLKLSEYSYTLRDDGKRDSADEIIYDTDSTTKHSHTQFNWTYDDAGRLTDEVFTDVSDLLANVENYHTTFEYDLTGNRLKQTTITDDDGMAGFDATTDTDEVINYERDVNDRMTSEDRAVDGNAVDSTAYQYAGTQQSAKTITDSVSSVLSVVNYSYDLQGRLAHAETHQGAGTTKPVSIINYRYGTDGIRISATTHSDSNADGAIDSIARTEYLIDARNHTGYQQVLEETAYDVDVTTGAETETSKIVYTIGHDHISQTTFTPGGPVQGTTAVFHMDGHGSTRILTDLAGTIATVAGAAQIYHYTAYGNAINFQMANAATQYLYSGEQFDARIGQQYLRARYYNQTNGTFNRLDPFFGNTSDPQSFHKYLYTHGDPVNGIDPTGNSRLIGVLVRKLLGNKTIRRSIEGGVYAIAKALIGTQATYTIGRAYIRENFRSEDDVFINSQIARKGDKDLPDLPLEELVEMIENGWKLKPDIQDLTAGDEQFYEVKSFGEKLKGAAELDIYEPLLQARYPGTNIKRGLWDPVLPLYIIETAYGLPVPLRIKVWNDAPGLIVYETNGDEDAVLKAVIATEVAVELAAHASLILAAQGRSADTGRAQGAWGTAFLVAIMVPI